MRITSWSLLYAVNEYSKLPNYSLEDFNRQTSDFHHLHKEIMKYRAQQNPKKTVAFGMSSKLLYKP